MRKLRHGQERSLSMVTCWLSGLVQNCGSQPAYCCLTHRLRTACIAQSTSHASPPSTSYLSTEEGVRNMWSFWPLENYSAVKMNNVGITQAITWRNLGNNGQVKGIRQKRLHIVWFHFWELVNTGKSADADQWLLQMNPVGKETT